MKSRLGPCIRRQTDKSVTTLFKSTVAGHPMQKGIQFIAIWMMFLEDLSVSGRSERFLASGENVKWWITDRKSVIWECFWKHPHLTLCCMCSGEALCRACCGFVRPQGRLSGWTRWKHLLGRHETLCSHLTAGLATAQIVTPAGHVFAVSTF